MQIFQIIRYKCNKYESQNDFCALFLIFCMRFSSYSSVLFVQIQSRFSCMMTRMWSKSSDKHNHITLTKILGSSLLLVCNPKAFFACQHVNPRAFFCLQQETNSNLKHWQLACNNIDQKWRWHQKSNKYSYGKKITGNAMLWQLKQGMKMATY